MKIKISEATPLQINYLVAKCEGFTDYDHATETMLAPRKEYGRVNLDEYSYSTDWAQGGPIIEREGISVQCIPAGTSQGWWAIKDSTFHDRSRPDETRGDTPLIAAMRCYVASKLGDEVEIPDELK